MMASNKSVIDCERFFRRLQTKLSTCWQPLATHCGFESDKIKTIRMMNDDPEEQAFELLCTLRKQRPDDWAKMLMEGLMLPAVGRQDVLDDVEQFLKKGNLPLAALTQTDGNAAPSTGPVTRRRSKPKSVPAPQDKCVAIPDIKPKLVDKRAPWYMKVWKQHMISDEPKVGKSKSYFHCFLTDISGVKIYASFFLANAQKCKDVYNAIEGSSGDNPVFLRSLKLEKQRTKYKALGTSNYKLVFDDNSEKFSNPDFPSIKTE
ncbi:uncharacterized protein LOC119729531 [Patiria miniata]|uniref:Uncharacterized protein n=1 Tax=Patiria miniata TaxID=46514 RepID=A0A914A2J1_PATMI|nr:uncharacterized protein LOC119729531 [Patiria miniata]XP_038058058.1 uncharacterized protein LOC119729531 [Patiria miniata]XP_038058059.1 uncharacterized protein LOC119729531 [Patiria miniata]